MVRMYYNMIKKGIFTLEQVPEFYRAQVKEMLENE